MNHNYYHRILAAVLLGAGALFNTSASLPAQATYVASSSALFVTQGAIGVRFDLNVAGLARGAQQAAFSDWPLARMQGYMLPARNFTLRVNHSNKVNVVYDALDSDALLASVPRAEPRKVLDNEGTWIYNAQDLADQQADLPAAPVTVLRDSTLNGARWVVISVSPIFQTKGEARQATRLSFHIEGAQQMSAENDILNHANLMKADPSGALMRAAASVESTCATNTVQPNEPLYSALANPALRSSIWRASVSKTGIQKLVASSISGLPAGTPISQLQVWRDGAQLPLDVIDKNGNGVFDGTDEVRFGAAVAGDRNNITSGYWFSVGPANVSNARMAIATDTPAPVNPSVPVAKGSRAIYMPIVINALGEYASAFEAGEWRDLSGANNTIETRADAGAGDHVFIRNWFVDATEAADASRSLDGISTGTTLPRAAGVSNYYADTVRRIGTPTSLDVKVGATWSAKVTNSENSPNTAWNAIIQNSDPADTLSLRLTKGVANKNVSIYLQRIRWERPVALDFASGQSANLVTRNNGLYTLSNLPAGTRIYDITTPGAAKTVQIVNNRFSGVANGRYAVVTPDSSTISTPSIAQYSGFNDIVSSAAEAQAIYVAPSWGIPDATPLATHRTAQGYPARVVDVQSIYDWFGNGDVSPEAIRSYMRYARDAWTQKPVALTLVGDGSNDPFNRVKLDYCTAGTIAGCTDGIDYVQPNIIPPYLANVDAFINETACEGCFARLDCTNPLDDDLPDIYMGRISVLNAAQLKTVVDKIIAYETAPEDLDGGAWRNKALYFADDADDAGSFSDSNTKLMAGLPNMTKGRFDYAIAIGSNTFSEAVKSMLNAGAGLVHYNGHGANTLWAGQPILFTSNDASNVNSAGKNAFLIEMTCQTSQFFRASTDSASIDEVFLRNPNGPVAIFGPTGWDTIGAHELLMAGMYAELAKVTTPAQYKTAGELVMAAYTNVFNIFNSGHVDTMRTYMLLGDPLTKIRVKG